MTPPYRPDEVAAALLHAAERAGVSLPAFEVRADEDARVWIIRRFGRAGDGRWRFPFASPHGIYTPREVADLFLKGTWPFG